MRVCALLARVSPRRSGRLRLGLGLGARATRSDRRGQLASLRRAAVEPVKCGDRRQPDFFVTIGVVFDGQSE